MKRKRRRTPVRPRLEVLEHRTVPTAGWYGFGGDAQHTGQAPAAAQSLDIIHWQTPVDQQPQFSGNDLLIHYGSPVITPGNTVIVPVKTGATNGFQLEAFGGRTGTPKWTAGTDYLLPQSYDWTPEYAPALTANGRVYFAGAGGTLWYVTNPDTIGAHAATRVAFYGLSNYNANPGAFNGSVYIDTPLTADAQGNVYFGYRVYGSNPLGLTSGIARIDASGKGTFVSASAAAADSNIGEVPHNCAPALSNDGTTLYVGVRSAGTEYYGYLLALDSTTLQTKAKVFLKDPRNNNANNAGLLDDSTASPTVGPDGDVYYGVFGNPYNGSRGWLLRFSSDLSQEKTPGAFGWDDTVSIVPASMVPSYHGSSSYLLFTKYNNYAGIPDGGDGVNKIAVLDPNATMTDPHSSSNGLKVMNVVESVAGPTPDPDFIHSGFPNAVREWCINNAAVDPATDSVLANSEDGKLYRFDLGTGLLTQVVTLTPGIGEAYTPTVVGPDGTVYAINDATLFAVGKAATPLPPVVQLSGSVSFGGQVVGSPNPAPEGATLTVARTGVQVLGVTASGPDAADFTFLNTPSGVLPQGQVALNFAFTPSHLGNESAAYTVATSAGSVTVHLSGSGTSPLRLIASALDFGTQAVGSPSASLLVTTLTVAGPGVQVLSVTGSGTNPADFTFQDPPPVGALARGEYTFFFSFTPSVVGPESAVYTVTTNDGAVTINLSGRGATTAAVKPLQLLTPSLNFGKELVGVPAGTLTTTLDVRQPGVQVLGVTASGPDAADFTFRNPPSGTLPEGGQGLDFAFTPSHLGNESAAYTVTTSAGSVTVFLSGSGTNPLRLSAPGVSFGSQPYGLASAVQPVTLTNIGAGVQVLGVAISGTNAADFTLLNPPSGTLAPGPLVLQFAFDPSTLGNESATFALTTSAGTVKLSLGGKGVSPPKLSAGAVSFGSFPAGVTSLQESVALTSLGAGVLFEGVTISGANAADFTLANASQLPAPGQPLPQGQAVSLKFTFKPTAAQAETAVAIIHTSLGDLTVQLFGVGL
jgi:hypothetical protein